jgi:asparagine synthase (glutamine-hydrolysing)
VRFRELLVDAVGARLEPAITWSQLSGGLDSSSVVAAAEQLVRPGSISSTVTLMDSLGEGDERPFRDSVLRRFNLSNHEVADAWPWQRAETSLSLTDEPHPLYPFRDREQRMRAAVLQNGGRVLLSGLGSDHYLYGNLSYIPDLVMAGRLMQAAREVVGWSLVNRQSFWTTGRRHVLKPLLRTRIVDAREKDPMRFPLWLGVGQQYTQRFDRIYDFMTRPPHGRMFAYYTKRELEGVTAWISRDVFEDSMEMRYPFLHRPLVEYALGLPVPMRVRPFARKWVLREAMRGLLPEEVRTRQSKGCIDARIIWAFQQEHATIRELVRSPILADLGLIDAGALRTAVEEARCGVKHNLVMLMSTLSLETWLAVRDGRFARIRKAA